MVTALDWFCYALSWRRTRCRTRGGWVSAVWIGSALPSDSDGWLRLGGVVLSATALLAGAVGWRGRPTDRGEPAQEPSAGMSDDAAGTADDRELRV
jgi:hypothetical protein